MIMLIGDDELDTITDEEIVARYVEQGFSEGYGGYVASVLRGTMPEEFIGD